MSSPFWYLVHWLLSVLHVGSQNMSSQQNYRNQGKILRNPHKHLISEKNHFILLIYKEMYVDVFSQDWNWFTDSAILEDTAGMFKVL